MTYWQGITTQEQQAGREEQAPYAGCGHRDLSVSWYEAAPSWWLTWQGEDHYHLIGSWGRQSLMA